MPALPRLLFTCSQASSRFLRLHTWSIRAWTVGFFPCPVSNAGGSCGFTVSSVLVLGLSHMELSHLLSPYSPLPPTPHLQPSTGPSPSAGPVCARRRRDSRPRSEAFCSDLVPESYAPIRLLAPPRPEFRSRFYPRLPPSGFRSRCVCPVARPFVCGCHTMSTSPYRSDDPRSPWVTHASSPPCRPHTPWDAGEEPMRLRLPRAGSTIPRLGPTGSSSGSLPSMTTRWFSAGPSDPTSRWAPCPPEDCPRWLQVPLGGVPLSRACPCRVLHTYLVLWPVRHDPHL